MSLIKRINSRGNAARLGLKIVGNALLIVPDSQATKKIYTDKAVRKRVRSKPSSAE